MSIRENRQISARARARTSKGTLAAWTFPILLLAPLGLGAKGCDAAVVGDDCAGADGKTEGCGGAAGGVGKGGQNGKGGQATKGGAANSGGSTGTSKDCGGLAGLKCSDGQYCAYPLEAKCGIADQTGTCTDMPDVCDDIYSPVCGCDGKTYANECEAAGKGVGVSAKGECSGTPSGADCGGLAGLPCKDGEFCKYAPDAACGAADRIGVCTPIPRVCDLVYGPVCGCDGKTYGNACAADANSVSVAKQGTCDVVACGGLLGIGCGVGEFCNILPEHACGVADGGGFCTKVPEGCRENYDPVCGCDGKTYGNECLAAAEKMSITRKGECPTGPSCGPRLDSICPPNSYCQYEEGAGCGDDATGHCAVLPSGCTKEFAPVCGCDGTTYGNRCMAASMGVSIVWEGACK